MTERTKKDIDYTLSTFAVEGLTPSKEAIRLCKKTADGEITLDEAIYAIKTKYGVAGDRRV